LGHHIWPYHTQGFRIGTTPLPFPYRDVLFLQQRQAGVVIMLMLLT